MSVTLAPHAHKVRLVEVSTGTVIERWPVDARELVASGSYRLDDASGVTAAPAVEATVSPVPGVPAAVDPAAVDPMPHVTQAEKQNAAQSPTGAPLVIAPASGVTAAPPANIPANGSNGRPVSPVPSPVPATPRGRR